MTMSAWHYILLLAIVAIIIGGVVIADRTRASQDTASTASTPGPPLHSRSPAMKPWMMFVAGAVAILLVFLGLTQRFSATAPNEKGEFVVMNHLVGTAYFCRGYECGKVEFK